MTTTQNPAQDVSDADLGAALREFRQHFPLQASAAWHYATERAKDMNVARELQQAKCPNCLNDGCHCATCNPYPGELQQAQVVGEALEALIDAAERHAANYDGDDRQDIKADVLNAFYAGAKYTTPQSSAPVVDEVMREAWCDWYDEYLTDGNGHAPVKTGEACHAAFVAAYPGGLKAAREAALTAWNKLHPQSSAPVVGEVVAWAVDRDQDPTFPRIFLTEAQADNMVNHVTITPPATKRPVIGYAAMKAALESALTGRGL